DCLPRCRMLPLIGPSLSLRNCRSRNADAPAEATLWDFPAPQQLVNRRPSEAQVMTELLWGEELRQVGHRRTTVDACRWCIAALVSSLVKSSRHWTCPLSVAPSGHLRRTMATTSFH